MKTGEGQESGVRGQKRREGVPRVGGRGRLERERGLEGVGTASVIFEIPTDANIYNFPFLRP